MSEDSMVPRRQEMLIRAALLRSGAEGAFREWERDGAIEVQTFDGLPEHRMVPSPSQPETMRVINTITAFIRRHTA